MKFKAKNLEETKKVAEDFILNLKPSEKGATVVGLYGDLGAGKTSFSQGVGQFLGISENIISPTFVIMKSYPIAEDRLLQLLQTSQLQKTAFCKVGFKKLIHIDAYRLEKSDELLNLGWQEIISDPQNLVLIEWPERVAGIMPTHTKINFSHISEDGREIEIMI